MNFNIKYLKIVIVSIFILFALNRSEGQTEVKMTEVSTYSVSNGQYIYLFKQRVVAYIMRKLYGDAFHKWVDIEYERSIFSEKEMWAMNDAADYLIRLNPHLLCSPKPQTLNLALSCWLSPELDSIAMDIIKPTPQQIERDPRRVIVSNGQPKERPLRYSDTTYLYHENEWCRAFKYLAFQNTLSRIMGIDGEFVQTCLSQDGSQEANLDILGDQRDYLALTKEASDSDFWFILSKENTQYYIAAFNFLISYNLDATAGKYYKEYLENIKK